VGGLIVPLIIIAIGIGFIVRSSTRKSEKEKSMWYGESSDLQDKIKDYESWVGEEPEWKKRLKNFENSGTIETEDFIHKDYIFTGSKEKWTQRKLKNVEIEAVFSGVELDFTQAELADDIKVAAHIKVKSVFSGVILYVPDDWNITIQKTGVFGGFADNRPNRVLQVASNKLVILEVEAVFGGGEIRCYE
jgi:predicted membrane protein